MTTVRERIEAALDAADQPITVEFRNKLLVDGKPLAVKLTPITPMEWAAHGRAIPAALVSKQAGPDGVYTPDDEAAALKFMRDIVARYISHVRVPVAQGHDDAGATLWADEWAAIRCVPDGTEPDPAAEPTQVPIARFDKSNFIVRCWTALIDDLNGGARELEGLAGKPFRSS